MAKRSSTKPAANARLTINRIVSTPMRTPPTYSYCDIRTGKSPSNVVGQKHSPSVAKSPQRSDNNAPPECSIMIAHGACARHKATGWCLTSTSTNRATSCFAHACKLGLEGIVSKRLPPNGKGGPRLGSVDKGWCCHEQGLNDSESSLKLRLFPGSPGRGGLESPVGQPSRIAG
jgi:hypothetical protein